MDKLKELRNEYIATEADALKEKSAVKCGPTAARVKFQSNEKIH